MEFTSRNSKKTDYPVVFNRKIQIVGENAFLGFENAFPENAFSAECFQCAFHKHFKNDFKCIEFFVRAIWMAFGERKGHSGHLDQMMVKQL